MARKIGIWLLTAVLSATVSAANARQAEDVRRIGFLDPGTRSSSSARIEAFRTGLREVGYIEGQNIAVEYRFTEGKLDPLPDLAAELVRLKVEVIVTRSTPAVRAAKNATSTIPIVMLATADPVRAEFVASLARPGGNITGVFSAIVKERAGALVVQPRLIGRHGRQIVDLAASNRLPTISGFMEFVDTGGLMSYGPVWPDAPPSMWTKFSRAPSPQICR